MILRSKLIKVWLIISISFISLSSGAQQKYSASDAPGPLSEFHTENPGLNNCVKCHSPDLEVLPSKCLDCHKEISTRITMGYGYHRNKGDDCSVCHIEHQGDEIPLVPLNQKDFDHDETGFILKQSHLKVKECRQCHRTENTIPREKFQSYLFKNRGCLICHKSPHPGNQKKCQVCHSQKDWRVNIWDLKENG